MAQQPINDNFKVNAPKPLDDRYLNGVTPWADAAAANAGIVLSRRHLGLTVKLASGDEYWWKTGLTNGDLILKTSGGGGGGGTQNISQVLDEGNDAGAKQIKNLANPTSDQDADTRISRTTAINAAVTALLGGVPGAGDTLNKLYNLIQAIVGIAPPEAFSAAGGAFPTTWGGLAIKAGQSYRITVGGTLGSINQKTVNAEDLLIALVAAPTNNGNDWQVVESNREQATTSLLGLIELGLDAEVIAGVSSILAVVPSSLLAWWVDINSRRASSVITGTATLDCLSKPSVDFEDPATQSAHWAIVFSNNGTTEKITYSTFCTGTREITMPANVVMEKSEEGIRWVNATKKLTLACGTAEPIELSFKRFNGNKYMLRVGGPYYSS